MKKRKTQHPSLCVMRMKSKRLSSTVDPFGRVKRHLGKRSEGVRLRVNLEPLGL